MHISMEMWRDCRIFRKTNRVCGLYVGLRKVRGDAFFLIQTEFIIKK